MRFEKWASNLDFLQSTYFVKNYALKMFTNFLPDASRLWTRCRFFGMLWVRSLFQSLRFLVVDSTRKIHNFCTVICAACTCRGYDSSESIGFMVRLNPSEHLHIGQMWTASECAAEDHPVRFLFSFSKAALATSTSDRIVLFCAVTGTPSLFSLSVLFVGLGQ